jgi:hypothetical protein
VWSIEPTLSTPTRRHTTEDGILHSHRRENLKSYMVEKSYVHDISQLV